MGYMEAQDHYLQDLFAGEDQYVVPVFQRRYQWEQEHWEALWDDLSTLLESQNGSEEHFIGAFVCMAAENRPGIRPQYLVIDGQQRFITLSVMLCSIRDLADELDEDQLEEFDGKTRDSLRNLPDEIQQKNLTDPYKTDIEKFRIVSRAEDRDVLFRLFEQNASGDVDSSVTEAYAFFNARISERAEDDPRLLKRLHQIIMQQLPLAMITASEEENPYTIFETLNERGLRLEESDLIRNYVFMQLDLDQQDRFNREHWLPFENKFEDTEIYDAQSLTRFYRIFLMKDGDYVRQNYVYHEFKDRIDAVPHELVATVDHFSDLYLLIRRPSTAEPDWLRSLLLRKEALDIGTADPLILTLLDRWQKGDLLDTELQRIFHGLESFAIRRSICGESTRGYYQIFPKSINVIESDEVVRPLFEYLDERGWPRDRRFVSDLTRFNLYSREPDKCRLILRTLQRSFGHKEMVELDSLQIEHVLPQEIGDDEHGSEWKSMLGTDWKEIHGRWLHTIGNLTLTGYNPELSNHCFDDKRELFEASKLDLNEYFVDCPRWTEEEIEERGSQLAAQIAEMWPVPEEVLVE